MKKRFVALVLSLVIFSSFAGCIYVPDQNSDPAGTEGLSTDATDATYEGYTLVDRTAFDFESEHFESVELTAGYDCLKQEAEQKCYKQLDKNLYYISDDMDGDVYNTLPIVLMDTKLTEAQLRFVISAYFFDHPEVFWVDNNFEYSNTTDNTVVQLSSYMSAEAITASAGKLSSEVQEIFSGITPDFDLYTRELYVHDMLIKRCVYAEDLSTVTDSYRTYTSLGALVDSLAVCEGYSKAMQLMLSGLGIESYNVLGRSTEQLHMWNCVKLGDQWYYVDSTWDDDKEDGVVYNYFNITTEQLLKDHTINPTYEELTAEQVCGTDGEPAASFNIFVPECTDESMSYYFKNAVKIADLGDNAKSVITTAIAEMIAMGEHKLYLYIDESLGFDYAVDNLFYSGDYVFFECIDEVNDRLQSVSVDRDSVSIRKSKDISIITVYLEYE